MHLSDESLRFLGTFWGPFVTLSSPAFVFLTLIHWTPNVDDGATRPLP